MVEFNPHRQRNQAVAEQPAEDGAADGAAVAGAMGTQTPRRSHNDAGVQTRRHQSAASVETVRLCARPLWLFR
jgi:hypothetical protein